MNENNNPLHRPLAAGDLVIVNGGEEYGGLSGQVKEVRRLGTPEHDTGNRTDDIIVDLTFTDYSDEMKAEITALLNELGYTATFYDDAAIDCAILAPEDLIQISEQEFEQYQTELTESLESACAVGDKLSAQHFDVMYDTLLDRVEKNYADYEREMLAFGAQEIFDMAARVHAVSDAYSYLTVRHNFSEEELRFYLQFQNPLDIAAQAWHERNMDVSDMSFSMDYIWERRDKVMEDNALVRETPPTPEHSEPSEPAKTSQSLTLREQLHEKMSAEYKGFLDEMKSKAAEDVLEA